MHLAIAQAVVARRHARRFDRVRYEAEPAARRQKDPECGLRSQVDSVDDRLDPHLGARERHARRPGVAWPPAPVRVVNVSDGARAAVEGGVGHRRVGVGVPDRDRHAAGHEALDEFERALRARAPGSSSSPGRLRTGAPPVRCRARAGSRGRVRRATPSTEMGPRGARPARAPRARARPWQPLRPTAARHTRHGARRRRSAGRPPRPR